MFILTFRFFGSCGPGVKTKEPVQNVEPRTLSPTQNHSPTTECNGSDGPSVPSLDTPSPPLSERGTSPTIASQGLNLFHWSGNSPLTEGSRKLNSCSDLVSLQQFQYKKETFSAFTKTHRSPGDMSPPRPSFTDGNTDDKEDLSDSPPSQDSAYFSQSQPQLTSCHKKVIPTFKFPTFHQTDAADLYIMKVVTAFIRFYKFFMIELTFTQHQSCRTCVCFREQDFLFLHLLFTCLLRKLIQVKILCRNRVPHTQQKQIRNLAC